MDRARYRAKAPAAFLMNTLTESGLCLKKITRKRDGVYFVIPARDAALAETAMQKKNIPFALQEVRGKQIAAKSFAKRFGFLAGLLAGVAVLLVYGLSLLSLDVNGLERVERAAVMQILTEEGVRLPAVRPTLDTKKLAVRLMEIDGVSQATVHVSGTRLIVDIVETLPEPEIVDTQTPEPLLSKFDGIVTRIVPLQGTPLVQVGDTVKKGQTLIAPYVKDAEGKEVPVRAMGEVYATVYFQRHSVYPDTVATLLRTGNTQTKTAMVFPGISYTPACKFATYETETSTRAVAGILPFELVTCTFYETAPGESKFDFQKEAARLVEEETAALLSAHGLAEGGERRFVIKRLDNSTILSIYYILDIIVTERA